MFKGIIRIIVSYSLVLFSLVLSMSLVGFSPSDLSFYTTALSSSYNNILGSLGTYISMPFVFFYGQAAWIWPIFSLLTGLKVLIGINPKILATRFAVTHLLVLLWATMASLISNNFSFVSGGVFGAMIGTMLTSVLPSMVWIPFLALGFLGGLVSVWNLPKHLFNKYFPKTVEENAPSQNTEDFIAEEDSPEESENHYESRFAEEFYEKLEKPHRYAVPNFLQEIEEEEKDDFIDRENFLSKKPIPFPRDEEDFLTRDVEIDLLAPYLKSENPIYDKLEKNEITNKTTLKEEFKDITESLDDLEGATPISPDSQWVRESGVSVVDFVRRPTQRLIFKDTQGEPLFSESISAILEEVKEPQETLENNEEVTQEILETHKEVETPNEELGVVETEIQQNPTIDEPTIPQHISNFPPVSALDSDTPIVLPEMDSNLDVLADVENQMNASTGNEISDSEKILLQGLERTIKKQQESNLLFKEKIQRKQQELANQFHNKTSTVDMNFHQDLTTSFALQDFEREILEMKEKSQYIDSVSQALSDDVFISGIEEVPQKPEVLEKKIVEDVLLDELMIPAFDEEIEEPTPSPKTESKPIEEFNIVEEEPQENLLEDYNSPQFASLMRLELGELPDISEITQEVSFSESPKTVPQAPQTTLETLESQEIKAMIQDFHETRKIDIPTQEEPSDDFLETEEPKIDVTTVNFDEIISDMESQIDSLDNPEKSKTDSNLDKDPFAHLVQDNNSLYEEQESMSLDDVMHFVEETDETKEEVEQEVFPENLETEEYEEDSLEEIVAENPTEEESMSLDDVMTFVEDTDETKEKIRQEVFPENLETEEYEEDSLEEIVAEEPTEEESMSLDDVMHFVEETDETKEEVEQEVFPEDLETEEYEEESLEEIVAENPTEEESMSLDDVMHFVEETDETKEDVEQEVFPENLETEEYEEDSLEEIIEPIIEEPQHIVIEEPEKNLLLDSNEIQDIKQELQDEPKVKNLDKEESDLFPSVVTEGHLVSPMDYPADDKKQIFFPKIEDLTPNTDNISKFEEDEEIEGTMKMIEDTYESFNINMQVVDYNRGPTVTRFELEPPSGLKLSKIFNLQDDLALQAGTSNIRIISPVEGRSLIGIEVPNKVRRNFLLREQIESSFFEESRAELPLILGIDVGGKEMVSDLATTPHLLIAGTTGSGKSVYVNALIMGLLFKLPAEDLRFIMIDPKMVELELYSGIPHLLAPIITKPEEAMAALEWAVQEMDRRYKLFSELGVRNIKEYKNTIQNHGEKLPYIVIIVDEFANLMLRAPKDTEKHISRLAAMSRAVGIHLVLATQRPSVDIVTGVIKANFPSRIALRVSSKTDSGIIIDRKGAETLLGKGDMFFMSPEHREPVRVQSPYVSNEDISRAVAQIKKNGTADYVIDFSELLARQEEESSSDSSRTDSASDPLFEEVLNYAVDNGEVSASGIQRRFRVGYNRASRLIETMKDLKVISPPQSAGKGWMINITRDEISKFLD